MCLNTGRKVQYVENMIIQEAKQYNSIKCVKSKTGKHATPKILNVRAQVLIHNVPTMSCGHAIESYNITKIHA